MWDGDLAAPTPLPGGFSGETYLAQSAGEPVVVRIYAGRSAGRGPRAAEVDAAVLAWVRGLVPVADVLEVRPGDPGGDVPAILVTSFLPGVLLEELLPDLDDPALARVGRELGTLLGRLALMATPRPGLFLEPELRIDPMPAEFADLPGLVQHTALRWDAGDLRGLSDLALAAQTALDTVRRTCLVHSDVNPKNLLVDPDSLEVTGLVDWEFAHSGSPYTDLGNLLRFDREPAFVEAVLVARGELVPDQRDDVLDLARAADLFGLVQLAGREGEHRIADRAAERLRAVVTAGDLHAT